MADLGKQGDVNKDKCSVPDCARPVRYKKLCNAHYLRNMRHGDPLGSTARVPLSTSERFESKVVRGPGCWTWTAAHFKKTGYALICMKDPRDGVWRPTVAHRVSYELFVGPIPEGKVLDHLCRNRGCVNPAHLDLVQQQENVRRGMAPSAISHRTNRCQRGHEFTPENTYVRIRNGRVKRDCRECARRRERERSPRRH